MRRTEIISGTMAAETVAAETKAGKGRLSGAKKAVTAFCGAAYLAVGGLPMTVFASGAGTSAITQPLDNLKTLVIAVIGAVGVIILAKNVMEFAQAYQQQDSSTMNSALKGIVADHDGKHFCCPYFSRFLRKNSSGGGRDAAFP